MSRERSDPTIYEGLRLLDGTDNDTIVARVAYGGFGVIAFGPNRLRDNEMVAYKTLRRELLEDPATRASFVRECLLWIGLWEHPNITTVHAVMEMGDAEGQRPFIALYYAENGSLRDLLLAAARAPEGRLPLDLAISLAQQIAAGLTYLHAPDHAYLRDEPTVHRDLKPENVLLMGDGRAVITDFGLAKIVEDASPETLATLVALLGGGAGGAGASVEATQTTGLHTAVGMAMGTAAYMPPEQWQDARAAGTPADIYAFGLILSELLTGRHALLDMRQPHTQANWRQAHERPAPRLLRSVDDRIPLAVETLYLRCLAADPAARPSAAEALAQLQAGARALGMDAYQPWELADHSPYNEFVHWHRWSIACASFERFEEALERSDRALALASQLPPERAVSLAYALNSRANILNELGLKAAENGDQVAAARWDAQAEATYMESLALRGQEDTEQGRTERATVWHQLGIFHSRRDRWAQSDAAFARALALKPDMPDTYHGRAINLLDWGRGDARAGRLDDAIAHLRQARVEVITSLGMNYPPARGLLETIEKALRALGVA
jgi:serine/threonine protein kinase